MKKLIYLVVLMAVGLPSSAAFAQDLSGCYWSANLNKQVCPDGEGKGPNHNDEGIPLFGGCNKKGDWCWEINIDPPYPPKRLPIVLYGGEARGLIARGEITHANLSRHGVFFLDVWSRYYNSSFLCEVNVSRRTYHCEEDL